MSDITSRSLTSALAPTRSRTAPASPASQASRSLRARSCKTGLICTASVAKERQAGFLPLFHLHAFFFHAPSVLLLRLALAGPSRAPSVPVLHPHKHTIHPSISFLVSPLTQMLSSARGSPSSRLPQQQPRRPPAATSRAPTRLHQPAGRTRRGRVHWRPALGGGAAAAAGNGLGALPAR